MTFTCILYPQCTHMIFIIYTSSLITFAKIRPCLLIHLVVQMVFRYETRYWLMVLFWQVYYIKQLSVLQQCAFESEKARIQDVEVSMRKILRSKISSRKNSSPHLNETENETFWTYEFYLLYSRSLAEIIEMLSVQCAALSCKKLEHKLQQSFAQSRRPL